MTSDNGTGRGARAKLIKICEPNFRDDIEIVFDLDGRLHSCRPAWLVRDEEIAAMSDEDAAQVRAAVARNPRPPPKSAKEIAEGNAFNEAKWGAFDDEDARSFAGNSTSPALEPTRDGTLIGGDEHMNYVPVYAANDALAGATVTEILRRADVGTAAYATGSRSWGIVPSVHPDAWPRVRDALESAGYEYDEHMRMFTPPAIIAERRRLAERAAERGW